MVGAISNVTQAQPVAQSTGTSAHKPTQSKPQPAPQTDSVQLSSTAQAMLASMQKAKEAPAQTTHQGNGGGHQAHKPPAK
jgi:hypothetical protein